MTTSTTTISYNWKISGLGTREDAELGLIVTNVYWIYQGHLRVNEQDANCWEHLIPGCLELADPDPNQFTEFVKLSEAQVIDWVQEHIGVTAIDSYTKEIETSIRGQQSAFLNQVEWQTLPWQQ